MEPTQRQQLFRSSVRTAVILPVIALLLLATFLVAQVLSLIRAAKWVDHTDQVIAQANKTERIVLDISTGQRAYVPGGEPDFQTTPHSGQADSAKAFADLERDVSDNPSQLRGARAIEQIFREWQASIQQQIDRPHGAGAYPSLDEQRRSKQMLDSIRARFEAFIATERALRTGRLDVAQATASNLLVSAALVAVFGGLIVGAISWRSVRRLTGDYDLALADIEETNDLLSTTLHSIGDAVLVTDAAGRIREMNAVAEALTGWAASEARGRDSHEVFRIFNEETREPVASPVDRVLQEGIVVGLANHTILVHRDGRDVNIDDSGAPIKDGAGRLVGVVLVFRDITERRAEEAALHQAYRRERALNRIGEAIRQSRDPLDVEEIALRELAQTLGVDRAQTVVVDRERDYGAVVSEWHREGLPDLKGAYSLSETGVDMAQAFPLAATLVIPDVTDGPLSSTTTAILARRHVRATLDVPLSVDGEIVGLLGVSMADRPRTWTPDEVAFVEAVASQLRSATEARRQLRSAEERAARQELINRIGEAIRNSTSTETIQQTAVSLLGDALQVDRCYFAIYDMEMGAVTVSPDWRRPDLPSIQGTHGFPNTQAMFQELYKSGTTSVVFDRLTAELTPQTKENMERLQLRSRVSVALVEPDRRIATLTAAMADAPREWTDEEVQIIQAVATQLRVAVEMASIQQREHRIATELQDALLPSIPEQVGDLRLASYARPALDEAAIGGDFLDVFPLRDGVYAMVVGDVSGKGLAAAAQLATVRNMLRAFLYEAGAPAAAATNLNAVLTMHRLLAGFVTAFVGIYDAESGLLRYASCGHEPGLIRRAASGDVDSLRTTGPPLGIAQAVTYGEETVRLGTGDSLLLYTDGLSEAGPTRRELLGTEGLIRCLGDLPPDLPIDEAAAQIIADAAAFARGIFRDDVCVLMARRCF